MRLHVVFDKSDNLILFMLLFAKVFGAPDKAGQLGRKSTFGKYVYTHHTLVDGHMGREFLENGRWSILVAGKVTVVEGKVMC